MLLWRSHLIPDIISQIERSLGTAPTQVRDDPSSRLNSLLELEEDEETELVDIPTHQQNSDSLSQSVSYGYGLGENRSNENVDILEKY